MEQQATVQPQPATRHIVVVAKQKSTGVALLLTFFFGPLGLLYASVVGGIVMIVLSIVIGIFTLGIGVIFTWIASLIWAAIAVSNHNKRTVAGAAAINS